MNQLKKILKILIILTLSSCALFNKNENKNYQYLQDFKHNIDSPETIEKYLTKELSMSGGNYLINILPLSKVLLRARAKKLSIKSGHNYSEINNEYMKKFSNNKVCLEINFTAVESDKIKEIKKWKVSLKGVSSEIFNLKWIETAPIVKSEIGRGFRKIPQWLGSGVTCTDVLIPLGHGIEVFITPNFVQWPFSSTDSVTWEVVSPDVKGGKYLKKKVQRYRGW